MWVFKYTLFLFSRYLFIFMSKQMWGLVWFQGTLISKTESLQVMNNTCLYGFLIAPCFFPSGTGKIITLAWNPLWFEFEFHSFSFFLVNTALMLYILVCWFIFLKNILAFRSSVYLLVVDTLRPRGEVHSCRGVLLKEIRYFRSNDNENWWSQESTAYLCNI